MMSKTIVGVTEKFSINLEVLSAHFMQFFIFGAKTVKNSLKTAKVSLNICGPQVFSIAAKKA